MLSSLADKLVEGLSPADDASALEGDWRIWLRDLFPAYVTHPFGEHHAALWDWIWDVGPDSPRPFIAIWARGAAKSTTAELATAAIAVRRIRRYGLYISRSQEQADDHVANVAALLESPAFEAAYPAFATRAVGKYGASKGWRRNRLRTAGGFTLDAIGLDTAARGVKLDEHRPDWIVLDDLDGELDTATTVEKKVATLTRKLLPAGAANAAVLAVQNVIIPHGIFARLAGIAEEPAEFLADRIVSGPFPALRNAAYEQQDGRWVIVAGEPTWQGQSHAACQAMVDRYGLTAFRVECQHEVDEQPGGMFDHLDFQHALLDDLPDLVRVVVWVDPAVTSTDRSDSFGIQCDGLAADGTIYRLWSWEDRTTPLDALIRALKIAVRYRAEAVGVETDQGGETWETVYAAAWDKALADGTIAKRVRRPRFRWEKAGAGHGPKAHRASEMLVDYETARIVHVLGTHEALERALRRFPRTKPFDLTDASYWSWHDLRHGRKPLEVW